MRRSPRASKKRGSWLRRGPAGGFAKAFGCLLALSTGCSSPGGEIVLPVADPSLPAQVQERHIEEPVGAGLGSEPGAEPGSMSGSVSGVDPSALSPSGWSPGVEEDAGEGALAGDLDLAEAARLEHGLSRGHEGGCPSCHGEEEPRAPLGAEERGLARASCGGCHDLPEGGEADLALAPSAPQQAMVEGRGSALVAPLGRGPHRLLEESCAACHMALPEVPLVASLRLRRAPVERGGHTLWASLEEATPEEASGGGGEHLCAGCHGEATAPSAIGSGHLDLDGDGQAGALDVEHRRALTLFRERFLERLRAQRVEGACGRVAAELGAQGGRLLLRDARGTWLGDCDGDGRLGEGERGLEAASLPAPLGAVAHDLWMLSEDGSAGVHNALYVAAIFDALRARLR